MRHLCWLQQIGWFALAAFVPCQRNLNPVQLVLGLSAALPVAAPPLPGTIGLSVGCSRRLA